MVPTTYCPYDVTNTTSTSSYSRHNSDTFTWETYTITCSNYRIDTKFLNEQIKKEHIRMIRSGWNNPPIIGNLSKPILPNLKTVIRSQLPVKIRAD